jgi:hypothetical protein
MRRDRIAQIGILVAPGAKLVEGFKEGLQELGWIEGKNAHLELRAVSPSANDPSETLQSGHHGRAEGISWRFTPWCQQRSVP